MNCHGNKVAEDVAEDAVFTKPCVVMIFDEAPRYREVQSKSENKQPTMTVPETGRAAQHRCGRRHVYKQDSSWGHACEQDLLWRAKGNPKTRSDNERDGLV